MKIYTKLYTLSVVLVLGLMFNSCQKAEVENAEPEKNLRKSFTSGKGFPTLRAKMAAARKMGRFTKEASITDFNNGFKMQKNARTSAAEKGCGKFKTITTTFPNSGYDEIAVITYRANNLIDYIDFSYSDDPSYNGRLLFTYSANMTKLIISYKYTDGVVLDYVDNVTLNEKGYATLWEHDFSNSLYEMPYLEIISYNSAGYPTQFINAKLNAPIADPKSILWSGTVKYSAANNMQTVTDMISGEVTTYYTDLTRTKKIELSYYPFYWDFTHLYGANGPNDWTKLDVKDKSGKLIRTIDLVRELNADGYPTKITRKVDGKDDVIFKNMTYDCKNYNISQPRSYK